MMNKGDDNELKKEHALAARRGDWYSKCTSTLALAVAIASFVVALTNKSTNNESNTGAGIMSDPEDNGEEHVKTWVADSLVSFEDRQLFSTESAGCSTTYGTTTCMDEPYVSNGILQTSSGCAPYSAYFKNLKNDVVPGIVDDHEDWGEDVWASYGYSASCNAAVRDYELYGVQGSSSCVTSVRYAIVTQLRCLAYTGFGGGGGGSGGGGGAGGGGGGGGGGCPFCGAQSICELRLNLGFTDSCDYCEPGEC